MTAKVPYPLLFLLMALVYMAGLFVTLFENDSAQFAVMAMRMVKENDFVNLFKGPEEYLDKPHMHYWLAALSYLVFGIQDWAYRIPALLATALGAYSCYGLGKVLYEKEIGKLAALVFLSSQTIVLAGIDVRTDAVLTGFTAFAIWQFASYVQRGRLIDMTLGALGAGLAFSTKGQIALLVIALPLLCHLAYLRKWRVLWDWKVLAGLCVFALAISPVLYAYYHQFDLHPEKVIRGRDGRSGILFIFWEQSFERLSGEGVGKNSSDYFFFFHTFLWVFLPWTVLGICAYVYKARDLFRYRFGPKPGMEVLTLGGISLIFVIISFAQFKLPHYLNITIPLFAVLSAAFLHQAVKGDRKGLQKVLLGAQYVILVSVLLAGALICFVVFKLQPWYLIALLFLAAITGLILPMKRFPTFGKIVWLAVGSSVFLNLILNLHFYPSLLQYQGGSAMALEVKKNNIPGDAIFKINQRHSWALDFYIRNPISIVSVAELKEMSNVWVYADATDLEVLESKGIEWDQSISVDQFRITRLQARFLDPGRRPEVLHKMYLIHLP